MPRLNLAFFLTLFLSLVLSDTSVKTCYTPQGVNRNEQLNYTDGLCYNSDRDQYWRESCTDPTWKHPACIKLFMNGTGFDGDEPVRDGTLPLTDVLITPCQDGSYYSGNGASATRCCENGHGLYILDGQQVNEKPNTTTGASSSGSASQPSQASDHLGLTSGAGIGIGLAIGIIVSLATVGVVFYLVRRRINRDVPHHESVAGVAPDERMYGKPELPTPPHLFKVTTRDSARKPELSSMSDSSRVELP